MGTVSARDYGERTKGIGVDYEMKVLFLQPQPCVRALKYAKGLKWALGNRVYIVFGHLYHTLNELYGHGDEFFDEFRKLNAKDPKRSIRALVGKHHPQLIHSHNAPDLLTTLAIETVDDVPIIHDMHEILSLQETGYYVHDDEKKIFEEYPRWEMEAVERSDGRIYATEGMRDYIRWRYKVGPEEELVFNSYVSRSVMPQFFKKKLSKRDGQMHIVYIGTVTSLIKGSHYDLGEIFKQIASRKMHIHIYISKFSLKDKAYEKLAENSKFIHYHGHLKRRILLREITQYDYGWAGFNVDKNERLADVILPNKIIEYIASGLPILAFPHKVIKSFIEKYKIGIVFEDIDGLAQRLKEDGEEISNVKKNALKVRNKLTIEKNIDKIIGFYEELMKLKG